MTFSLKQKFNGAEKNLSIVFNKITAMFLKGDGDGLLFNIQTNNADLQDRSN